MPRRKPDDDDLKAREVLANRVTSFRKQYLMTQKKLADILELSRRTIQMVEAAKITPHPATIQAFEDLVKKYKEAQSVLL